MKLLVSILCLLLAACGDSASPSSGGNDGASKPNVVVVVVDTLRPDHLPLYGYSTNTAPFLSALAARSVVFRRAFSSSTWTAPATASLFTSLYPPQHGVLEGFFVHRTRTAESGQADTQSVTLNRLPDNTPTLPEHFARAGWQTFGVVANVNITERLGFQRGFAQFRDFTGLEYGKGGAADLVLEQLRSWKPALSAGPHFLYVHLNDVHSPWRDRENVLATEHDMLTKNRMAYDSEIRFVDTMLGKAHTELGWSKNTILCIVSDHGEEFMEHGQTGHNLSVYRELMQVVMLVSWPERWRGPREVVENASLIDVFPTLVELSGAPYVAGLEGRSLVDVVEGRATVGGRALFAHRIDRRVGGELWAVVRGDWKLIQRVGGGEELYRVSRDPAEKLDLAAEEVAVVQELRRELEGFRARAKRIGGEAIDVQLDAAEIEKLKTLGYAGDEK